MSSKGAGVSVHHAGSGNLAPLCLTMRWGNSSSQVMIELCEGGVFVMVVKCVCVWGGVGGTENIYKENLIRICPL